MSDLKHRVLDFIDAMGAEAGLFRSAPRGPATLYGTGYALLTRYYVGVDEPPTGVARDFIRNCQDADTGLFIGPELADYTPPAGGTFDREHLLLHLTCATLPVCQQFGIPVAHPVRYAHRWLDLKFLEQWLAQRNWQDAWLEGNNLLFVGQLLAYLRDVEHLSGAAEALQFWFSWLDEHIDLSTSLWGTSASVSPAPAVYGGYHQLLVYYHEGHAVPNDAGLIDTVLGLQHPDGGFNPHGNGGACEDVDAVDILVNACKRCSHRRTDIRLALRRCLRHILDLQNPDGGFPYNRDLPQSHMGIPLTQAGPNESTMFATWFRVHTLALIHEILTDEPALTLPFRFSTSLSMGWHRPWDRWPHRIRRIDRLGERVCEFVQSLQRMPRRVRGKVGSQLRRLRRSRA